MPDVPLSQLFVPEVVIPGVAQRATRGTGLIRSGIMARSPELDALLKGGGNILTVPSFRPLRARSTAQKRNNAPAINGVGEDIQKAPRLQREVAFGADAITRAFSLQDPLAHILGGIADNRAYDRQCILLNILRGVFGNTAAGAFKDIRKDIFVEDGAAATADNLVDSDAMQSSIDTLGELKGDLVNGGAIACHSKIEAALNKQDQIETIKASDGTIILRLWRGKPLFLSDDLVRPGVTSGFVYDTYIFGNSVVASGDLAQSMNIGDTASLILDGDAAKNNQVIYDRTDFYLAPVGAKWNPGAGVPANGFATPSDAELATEGNWALGIQDPKTIGIVCLRTNG